MSSREEIEEFIRERLNESKQFNTNSHLANFELPPEFQEKLLQMYVEEALQTGKSVEELKENSKNWRQLMEAHNSAVTDGQPLILLKKDAATGIELTKFNCGTYHTITPTELILMYDFWKATFRLSKTKEWISFSEIISEMENSEYVEDWYSKLLPIILYAQKERVIEIDKDDENFRILKVRKVGLITRFLEYFARPEEKLNELTDRFHELKSAGKFNG